MKIAILDDYQGHALDLADWGDLAAAVTTFTAPIPPADRAATLAPFDILCVMRERTPLPAELIAALPNLKLIVTTGMRNPSIDVTAAKARGIPVCGTASRTPATAQLAMTLILAGTRNLLPNVASTHAGGWQVAAGRDLDGLTLGLVGLGRLGAAVAALARPFGMSVLAWSQNLTEARCAEVGVQRAETLPALLSASDVVSLHLVLSERTRGLIGSQELRQMRPDALLVNTSRGALIDTDALLAALHAGRPGRAALDVFEEEPLPPGHPLTDPALTESGRLILTPHIGYGTLQTYAQMYRGTVEAIRAWQAGAPVRELAG